MYIFIYRNIKRLYSLSFIIFAAIQAFEIMHMKINYNYAQSYNHEEH